jgi:hypothetical protein
MANKKDSRALAAFKRFKRDTADFSEDEQQEFAEHCWQDEQGNAVRRAMKMLSIDGVNRGNNKAAAAVKAFQQRTASTWSSPDTPSRFAKLIYKVSLPTFRKMIKGGTVRVNKLTRHKWQVHTDDLPAISRPK